MPKSAANARRGSLKLSVCKIAHSSTRFAPILKSCTCHLASSKRSIPTCYIRDNIRVYNRTRECCHEESCIEALSTLRKFFECHSQDKDFLSLPNVQTLTQVIQIFHGDQLSASLAVQIKKMFRLDSNFQMRPHRVNDFRRNIETSYESLWVSLLYPPSRTEMSCDNPEEQIRYTSLLNLSVSLRHTFPRFTRFYKVPRFRVPQFFGAYLPTVLYLFYIIPRSPIWARWLLESRPRLITWPRWKVLRFLQTRWITIIPRIVHASKPAICIFFVTYPPCP